MPEASRWSAEDTTPSAVEAALRRLLEERHAETSAYAPARVLNLVVVIDRAWRGEIENRLERVGRYHPSRTIVCAVEPRRTTMDAWATMSADGASAAGEIAVGEERVELTIGEQHARRLETIVDPLLVPDLETLIWSPHGHPDAVEALRGLADVVLIDSVAEPEPVAAIGQALEMLHSAYVVDLAWIRSAPWRERVAASFDPPRWRPALGEIAAVEVRHHPGSIASGGLLLGWLASRLGWEPVHVEPEDGGLVARARARGRRVRLRLEPDASMSVPGLSGITIEIASGMRLSLDRGSGGLAARRMSPGGGEVRWVVLGASRGEAGILGEGIRQALLRDPTYAPALRGACTMLR
jgi:glucose-6-phosphate dehydrogenase assembly protein OpcA